MNQSEVRLNPIKNKWKQFKFENLIGMNDDTLHTFGFIFENVLEEYFSNLVYRLYPKIGKMNEIEKPQRDKGYQRTYTTNLDMLNRSNLPRAVMMYNLDVNAESDYTIYSQQDLNKLRHNHSYQVMKLEYSGDDQYIDYLRDLTISIVAAEQESLATVFYTVLTESYPDNYEISKKLKMCFPDEGWTEIYKGETKDFNTDFMREIPYSVEYKIPDNIIVFLKRLLKIENDKEFLEFINKYSYNKIQCKISGKEQTYTYYVSVYSSIKLKCVSIDGGIVSDSSGHSTVHGTKLEFTLRYSDLPVMKLSINGRILNVLNPDNYETDDVRPDAITNYAPIYVRELPNDINGTTEYNTYEIEYNESDLKEYYLKEDSDEFTNKYDPFKRTVHYPVLPMVFLTDNRLVNEYIEEIIDDYFREPETITKYVNFIVTDKHKRELDEPIISNNSMSDKYIQRDYNTRLLINKLSKVGESVYISVYINKKHFNEWKKKKGYEIDNNLSAL